MLSSREERQVHPAYERTSCRKADPSQPAHDSDPTSKGCTRLLEHGVLQNLREEETEMIITQPAGVVLLLVPVMASLVDVAV